MARDNQVTVYLHKTDVFPEYVSFKQHYSKLSDSQIINAALTFSLSYANRGWIVT